MKAPKLIVCFLYLLTCFCCKKEAEPNHLVSYQEGAYTLELPENWTLRSGLNDQASLEASNGEDLGYLIVILDEKSSPSPMIIQEHSRITRGHMAKALEQYQEIGPEWLPVGPFLGLKYVLSGKIKNEEYFYWHVTVETEKHFHQFLFWSPSPKLWRNEAAFTSILASFHEK